MGTAAGAALLLGCSMLSFGRPAAAAPQPGPESRVASLAATVPPGAVDEGQAASSVQGQLEVVLAPSDPVGMRSLLAGLYDPSSPEYHHWLTPKQFDARFGPASATVAEAESWLRSKGLHPQRSSTFALTVQASTAALGRATGTAFHRYRTGGGVAGLVAEGAPLVPSDLGPAVSSIYGLSTLPAATVSSRRVAKPAQATARPAAATSAAGSVQACSAATNAARSYGGTAYTMDQLSPEYGISALQSAGLTGSGQTVGVFELSPYSTSDVSQYESCFALTNSVSRVSVDGGATDTTGTPEADLDIEQVATQAPGATIISYEAPNSDKGWYDLWSKIVNANQAQVISTSWGLCEADAWKDARTSTSTSTLLYQAASQGQTVVAASGDSGSEDCAQDYPNSGWNALGVDYPASDPSVTAVGGTYYNAPGETVWNDCAGAVSATACAAYYNFQAAGGGGVSVYETAPKWQTPVAGVPATSCGSGPCRQVPDVSANAGIPMVDYDSGGWNAGVGTSYASPLVAGLVADRNQGCSARTGNLAQLLYSAAGSSQAAYSLQDVVSGENDMLAAHSGSYTAATGYDLASGLGTPIGSGLACPDVVSVTQNANPGDTVTVTGVGLEDAQIFFGGVAATVQSETATSATVTVPAGSGYVQVSATSPNGAASETAQFAYAGAPATTTTTTTSTTTTSTTTTTTTPPTTVASPTSTSAPACGTKAGPALSGGAGIAAVAINGCDGYFVVDPAGQVSAFGAASSHGDLSGYRLAAPIIAIEATPDGQGYWLLGADGGVFSFGDAHFYGSTGGIHLNAPVVGMAVTPDNRGYWMVAKDGGVFSFGDARFYGSTGNLKLDAPVDGIAVAPGGHGYWLVASDGGVFTFTSDGFYGSLGGVRLAKPVVGMSSTPDGRGYTLVGSDGGVFTFGDAPFYGSLGGHPPATPVVDLSPAPANDGYYLVTSGGAVYSFGPGTRYFGSV